MIKTKLFIKNIIFINLGGNIKFNISIEYIFIILNNLLKLYKTQKFSRR